MTELNPQLEQIRAEFEAATGNARKLLENVSAAQLVRRPGAQQWSAAECVEHLNITTRAYLPLLGQALMDARKNGILGNGPFRMDLLGRLLRWSLEPPPRFRLKTGKGFEPVDVANASGVLSDFVSLQQQLIERVCASEGLVLDRIKIASAFSPSLKYNLLSCFAILASHERRHLLQAEKALQAAK